MYNVLSGRELLILGYLSKSPNSFKNKNVLTTSPEVILMCIFHQETKMKKWLFVCVCVCGVCFAIFRIRYWILSLEVLQKQPMTTVVNLGLWALQVQFKGMSYMRLPFLFLSGKTGLRKK